MVRGAAIPSSLRRPKGGGGGIDAGLRDWQPRDDMSTPYAGQKLEGVPASSMKVHVKFARGALLTTRSGLNAANRGLRGRAWNGSLISSGSKRSTAFGWVLIDFHGAQEVKVRSL